jgi:hypothetical protein
VSPSMTRRTWAVSRSEPSADTSVGDGATVGVEVGFRVAVGRGVSTDRGADVGVRVSVGAEVGFRVRTDLAGALVGLGVAPPSSDTTIVLGSVRTITVGVGVDLSDNRAHIPQVGQRKIIRGTSRSTILPESLDRLQRSPVRFLIELTNIRGLHVCYNAQCTNPLRYPQV